MDGWGVLTTIDSLIPSSSLLESPDSIPLPFFLSISVLLPNSRTMPFFNRSVSVYTFYTEKPKVVPFKREVSRDVFESDDEDEHESVAVNLPEPRARVVFPNIPLDIDYENSSERIVEKIERFREPDEDEVPRAVPRPLGIYDHLPWPPLPTSSFFEAPYDKNGEPEEAVVTRDQALGFTTRAKYMHFPTSGQTFMIHRKVSYDVTAYWDARDGFERFPKPQNQVRLEKYREYELMNNGGEPLPEEEAEEVMKEVCAKTWKEPVLWDINECVRIVSSKPIQKIIINEFFQKRKHDGSEDPDAKRPRFGPMQKQSIMKRGLVFSAIGHDDEEEQVLPYLCGYKKKKI